MTMTKRNLPSKTNSLIIRLILIAVVMYLTTLGATYNGILALPELPAVTLAMFGVIAGLWLFRHYQRKLTWYATPLDAVFLLWGAAFLVSILANPETWRRSVEALWYMGLYVALWYLLSDLIAQGVRRSMISGALLIAGVIILVFGYLQVLHSFSTQGTIQRPASLIGNPNSLAALLVVLTPFALAQAALTQNRIGRWAMGLYALASLILLLVTFSRGAWLGIAAALVVLAVLVLRHFDLRTLPQIRIWLRQQSLKMKAALAVMLLVLLAGSSIAGILLVSSFSEGGRSIGLRTYLWEAGIQLFSEKPLTGYGLFTFGRYLPRFDSIPPGQPHNHAHNLLLTVAAETGIPGILAIAATLAVSLLWMRRNEQYLAPDQRAAWMGAVSALAGFCVHHLLDTPAMMPLIALVGLVTLVVAIAPAQPQPLTARWRKIGHPVGIAALWLLLLAVGFWNSTLYQDYYKTLESAGTTQTYRAAAEHLQGMVNADPRQPAYLLEQAYLYGLAASEGDTASVKAGIAVYQRYLALEPYHSTAWVNLAALAWQNHNNTLAIQAMNRAIALAPNYGFARQLDLYTGRVAQRPDYEPVSTPWGVNLSRFQYLRDAIDNDFLPQVGWGKRR